MVKKYLTRLKKHFKEVLRIKTTPFEIALGFSLGTFIAIFPTFGFGPLIGLVLVLIFKRISKVAMFLSFAIWNPLSLVPIYILGYKIGNFFFSELPIKTFKFLFLDNLYIFTRRVLVGNTILAFVISILSYFIIYFSVNYYQKKNLSKFLKNLNFKP